MKCFILTALCVLLMSFTKSESDTFSFNYKPTYYKNMGISIVLYRVKSVSNITDYKTIEKDLSKSSSVNLYKTTEDLSAILMNTDNPYSDTSKLAYKLLWGNYTNIQTERGYINGYLNNEDVQKINLWIEDNRLNSLEGFLKIYNSLSIETKQYLDDIGADEPKGLFDGYMKPLVDFYKKAKEEKKGIAFCGE